MPSWRLPARADRFRLATFAFLLAGLAAYGAVHERLPELDGDWSNVVFLSVVLFPATFGLVWLALPLRTHPRLAPAVGLLVGLTVALELTVAGTAANLAKLAAVTGLAWVILRFFEHVSWVVLVALLIIPVDIVSVERGPTKTIIEEQPALFDHASIAFPLPGERVSTQLGLPDVLFFGLFLAAASRFALRTGWSWVLMTCSFGGTIAIVLLFDLTGWAALPLLSAAFVVANADLLVRALRRRSGAA